MPSIQSNKPRLAKYKQFFTLIFSSAILHVVSTYGKVHNIALAGKMKFGSETLAHLTSFNELFFRWLKTPENTLLVFFYHFPSMFCTSCSKNFGSVSSRYCPSKLCPSFL